MRQIKIYNKNYEELTALNVGEYGGLTYSKTLGQIGNSSFTLDINNLKVTEENLRNYNRVEIEDNGVKTWVGYISNKTITFNQVTVQCKELIGILGKRLVGDAYTLSGGAGIAVSTLLDYINSIEDTGIVMGNTDVLDNINMTFNQQSALEILTNIADTVQAQFILNEDRTLDFLLQVGEDKSSDVNLVYNILQPQVANLSNFNVTDDGESIVTRSYGKSDTLTSVQDDIDLKDKYGILEIFNSFTQANTQTNLDSLTQSKLSDTLYSPTLNITPNQDDNFNMGDTVKINIQNKLVNINDTFQILEKSVKIVNGQKTISVKINKLPQTIVNTIRDLQRKINLLETNQ